MPTLVDLLQEYLRRPDVVERMKPLETAYAQALTAFSEFCAPIAAAIQRVTESPPSPGYEPWLVQRGHNAITARMMARLLVRSGKRCAEEDAKRPVVVRAIRFLANPDHKRRAKSRRVEVLLSAWEETSIIETIFIDAGLNEFEFIRLLRSVAEGQEEAYHRLREIAASLSPPSNDSARTQA